MKPSSAQLAIPPTQSARMVMLNGPQQGREYVLTGSEMRIGRGAHNDIVIADPQSSRLHATLLYRDGMFLLLDAGSTNGIYVNEARVNQAGLRDGDVIGIGALRMAFRTLPGKAQSTGQVSALNPAPEAFNLRQTPQAGIGRDRANMIVLDNPQVSRRHAELRYTGNICTITDLGSTNGTFVNGQPITAATPLNDGDTVQVGPYRFIFSQGILYRSVEEDSIRVDVLRLNQRSGDRHLLHDISLTILPREFMTIVGPSGSGKTTLMNALSGATPATGGIVLYNRSDANSQFAAYRSSIGYVPQEDIVHPSLSVESALRYAAQLRLPGDTTPAEIDARLDEVIEDLDLAVVRDSPIRLLSGGQRKRVSIGAELLAKPSLFFLDEPTSGLDPGLEARMMAELRKLADQGRTVVLITHATQSLALCDRLLVMAQGGYIAFYGPPDEALTYFGVSDFAQMYVKLEEEATPDAWAERFRASPAFERHVVARLDKLDREAPQAARPGSGDAMLERLQASYAGTRHRERPRRTTSSLRQFFLLTRRHAESLLRESRSLGLLLLQAPVIALLLALVFPAHIFDGQTGDLGQAETLVFLLVFVAVWFGTANAAREIVKEAGIFRRERRVGLRLLPYIFSKVSILMAICAVQNLCLLGIISTGAGWLGRGPETLFYLYLTLLLASFAGVTLGLLISALASSSDRALIFVPVVLIPQIIFSGAVTALANVGAFGNLISSAIVTRWGYEAFGTLISLNDVSPSPITFSGPPPEMAGDIARLSNGALRYANPDWQLLPDHTHLFAYRVTEHWLIMLALAVATLGLTWFALWHKERKQGR